MSNARAMRMRAGGNTAVAMIGGLVAAIIGAFVWAGIVYGTGYEVGYVAWGVGLLVGIVMVGLAKTANAGLGVSAAAFAALGLIVGKLLIVQWAMGGAVADELLAMPQMDRVIVTQKLLEEGELDADIAEALNDDSVEELNPAMEARLNAAVDARLASTSKEELRVLAVNMSKASLAQVSFAERISWTLSPWDFLWFGLALFTAFRIASGGAASTA